MVGMTSHSGKGNTYFNNTPCKQAREYRPKLRHKMGLLYHADAILFVIHRLTNTKMECYTAENGLK